MRIVAGSARGRRIDAPEGRNTRPTLDRVRENLFNMLQGLIADSRVLDLFAGSGALSFEAISRGALSAVLTEKPVPFRKRMLKTSASKNRFRFSAVTGMIYFRRCTGITKHSI